MICLYKRKDMKNNIFHSVLKSIFLTGILCAMGSVFAAESRVSPEAYREFAYAVIMRDKWTPSMINLVNICWDDWSALQRSQISHRMRKQGIVPPIEKEKMISATDYRTVAYINIMNQKWIPSMENLITNCWNGWSEEQKSNIARRVRDQGISIENISKNPKEQMLRGVEDK
jgi:hypothetical protein